MRREFATRAAVAIAGLTTQFPLGAATAQTTSASVQQEPEDIVRQIYRHFIGSAQASTPPYSPPESIYTPRLKSLVSAARRRAHGEAPCGLDFMFWVNNQDYTIPSVEVTRRASSEPNRATVFATFQNMATPEKIVFDFQKVGRRWLMNDARSIGGGHKWTFSRLLQCKE